MILFLIKKNNKKTFLKKNLLKKYSINFKK